MVQSVFLLSIYLGILVLPASALIGDTPKQLRERYGNGASGGATAEVDTNELQNWQSDGRSQFFDRETIDQMYGVVMVFQAGEFSLSVRFDSLGRSAMEIFARIVEEEQTGLTNSTPQRTQLALEPKQIAALLNRQAAGHGWARATSRHLPSHIVQWRRSDGKVMARYDTQEHTLTFIALGPPIDKNRIFKKNTRKR